jgi:hypothetical protein
VRSDCAARLATLRCASVQRRRSFLQLSTPSLALCHPTPYVTASADHPSFSSCSAAASVDKMACPHRGLQLTAAKHRLFLAWTRDVHMTAAGQELAISCPKCVFSEGTDVLIGTSVPSTLAFCQACSGQLFTGAICAQAPASQDVVNPCGRADNQTKCGAFS